MLYKIAVFSVLAYVEANDCNERHSLYEGMGCDPITEDSKTCPQQYNCQHLGRKSGSQCFFRGKYYNPLERIKTEFTQNTCMFDCRCGERGDVECAQFDCPQNYITLPDGCYHSYGDSCCPERVFCSNNVTTTCSIDGEAYTEGTSFSPRSNPCIVCRCEKGFKGIVEKPFCKEVQCRAGNYQYDNFLKNCAPLYGRSQCCVSNFKCPSPNERIVRYSKVRHTNAAATCRYGKELLALGDKIESRSSNITCECVIPPLVTCISDKDYEFN